MSGLVEFLKESLAIEGIYRHPTEDEINASQKFLDQKDISVETICNVQAVYAPGKTLRNLESISGSMGNPYAVPGGLPVVIQLGKIAYRVSRGGNPWRLHTQFEELHPFMDGNGRTGRIVWAWNMQRILKDPFEDRFLHRLHYKTLDAVGRFEFR